MSRSGYMDDIEPWDLIRWRGAVASAIRGRRGQAFLKEMLAALDGLPNQRLISEALEFGGEVCAIGSVGKVRNVDMKDIDVDDHEMVAVAFKIPHSFACEIMYINDEGNWEKETPEERFQRVRAWVVNQIRASK